MLYGNKNAYLFSSTRLNYVTTKKKHHSITSEILEKVRILWKTLSGAFAKDDNHKIFLDSIPFNKMYKRSFMIIHPQLHSWMLVGKYRRIYMMHMTIDLYLN